MSQLGTMTRKLHCMGKEAGLMAKGRETDIYRGLKTGEKLCMGAQRCLIRMKEQIREKFWRSISENDSGSESVKQSVTSPGG